MSAPELVEMDASELVARMTMPIRLGHTVDLRNLHVSGPVDLDNAVIGNIDLSGSILASAFTCRRATFSGQAWFMTVRFLQEIDATACIFESDCRFDGAAFSAASHFKRCEFRGVGCFDRVSFNGPACYDELVALGNLSLSGSIFHDRASARRMDCQGGLWLDHTEFRGGFDFHGTEVHGRTWLKGAQGGRQATYGAERAIAEKLSSHGYTYST